MTKDPCTLRSLATLHPIARPTEHLAIFVCRCSALYPRLDMISHTFLFHIEHTKSQTAHEHKALPHENTTCWKRPTIYIENYTFLLNKENVGRKYAILSKYTQLLNNQRITSTTQHPTHIVPPYALRKMPLRTTKDAFTHCERRQTGLRFGVFRNSIRHLLQANGSITMRQNLKNGDFAL